MKAMALPLCSPKARSAPVPLAGSRLCALERAVEVGRVVGETAVGGDQGALRGSACRRCWRPGPCLRRRRWSRGRAAGAGRPGCGTPMRDRVGAEAALDAAERGDDLAEPDIDEMDRDQAGFGGAFGPVADAADMAGVAQRDHGEAGGAGLGDAEVDGLRGDGLAEAAVAVDDGVGRAFGDDGDASGRRRPCPPAAIARSAARG